MWHERMRGQVGPDFLITEETDDYVIVEEGRATAKLFGYLVLTASFVGAVLLTLNPSWWWREMEEASAPARFFFGFLVSLIIVWMPLGLPICGHCSVYYRKKNEAP